MRLRLVATILGWALLVVLPLLKVLTTYVALSRHDEVGVAARSPEMMMAVTSQVAAIAMVMVSGVTLLLLVRIERRLNADKA